MDAENRITKSRNLLCVLYENGEKLPEELRYLVEHFCGEVVENLAAIGNLSPEKRIYVCGDLSKLNIGNVPLYIIREFASKYENLEEAYSHFVELGEVPVIVKNAGVYFRALFKGEGYFNRIETEHEFQHLTESNKPGKALRKGIYLTDVRKEETSEKEERLHFRLLRCSSNLTGPTDNFRATDREIIKTINEAAE